MVAVALIVLGTPRAHGSRDPEVDPLRVDATPKEIAAHRTTHRRENNVVDLASERSAEFQNIVERHGQPFEPPVRSELSVDGSLRRGVQRIAERVPQGAQSAR